jgi:predicted nucleotidyltransferase
MSVASATPPAALGAGAVERIRGLADERGLDLVVLFGSRARGVVHAGSDVDLAVLREGGPLESKRYWDLALDLGEACAPLSTDVVDLGRVDPLTMHQVFEAFELLFERPGALMRARLKSFHRYVDYQPFLDLERRAVREALGLDGG